MFKIILKLSKRVLKIVKQSIQFILNLVILACTQIFNIYDRSQYIVEAPIQPTEAERKNAAKCRIEQYNKMPPKFPIIPIIRGINRDIVTKKDKCE